MIIGDACCLIILNKLGACIIISLIWSFGALTSGLWRNRWALLRNSDLAWRLIRGIRPVLHPVLVLILILTLFATSTSRVVGFIMILDCVFGRIIWAWHYISELQGHCWVERGGLMKLVGGSPRMMKVIIVVVCWWRIYSSGWSWQFRVAWPACSKLRLFRSLIQNFHIRAQWLEVGLLRPPSWSLGNHQMLLWKCIRRANSVVGVGIGPYHVGLLILLIWTTSDLILLITFGTHRLALLLGSRWLCATGSLILQCHIWGNVWGNASENISIREVVFTCWLWGMFMGRLLRRLVQRRLPLRDRMMLVCCTTVRRLIQIVH